VVASGAASVADLQSPPRLALFQLFIVLAVVAVWAVLHWVFRDVLIFHDSWKHNFPEVYAVARNSACGQFAYWLPSPDTGSATMAYALSISLTQPLRVLLLNWWACEHPAPFDAMLFYEFQVFAIYVVFTLGMFVLGRVLYRHWLSAGYLAAATLFAGLAMQIVHSDQYVVLAFWVPWCAVAGTLAHRNAGTPRGAFYVNVTSIFFCVALGDQEPHAAALAGGCALLVYAASYFPQCRRLASRWIHLWPAAIFLCTSLAGFFVVREKIFDYLTSQHQAITFDLSQLGETGFVQPSAFLGMLFPLSFTSAFDQIQTGAVWQTSIYRLDALIFYIGTIPLLLLLSLFQRRGLRGAPLGWLIFSVAMLLASVQTSRLYVLLFHLPLFYLFRTYFFYFDYVVVGMLVLSGYGFDRLITAAPDDRKAVLRTTLSSGVLIFAAGAAIVAANAVHGRGLGGFVLHRFGPAKADLTIVIATFVSVAGGLWIASGCGWGAGRMRVLQAASTVLVLAAACILLAATLDHALVDGLRPHWAAIAGDAVILAAAFGVIAWAIGGTDVDVRRGFVIIAVLVATQSMHIVGVYGLLGQSARDIFGLNHMNEALLTPYSDAELADPAALERVPCATSGACYLAQRDAASLKRDLDGSFLRYRLNPVWQDELSAESRAALVGVTHPILWGSAGLASVASIGALDALVEAHKDDLQSFLRLRTYVVGAPPVATQDGSDIVAMTFSDWRRSPDRLSFHYNAATAGVVNLAVTNAPGWTATVNGAKTTPVSGNFATFAFPVHAGEGEVVLRYHDPPSLFFFWSRWLMGALGLIGIVVVSWQGRPAAVGR
jgi:hypothetical protein